MSFSYDIKTGLAGHKSDCEFCKTAELYGIMSFAATVKNKKINIVTEHEKVFDKIGELFCECMGFVPEKKDYAGGFRYEISDELKCDMVAEKLHLNDDPNFFRDELIPFECCRIAYIRGAFLGGGSVSDPQKNYHLEFDARECGTAEFLKSEIRDISVKTTERKNRCIVYIKGYEDIAALMGLIGAGTAAMEIYNVSIEREIRNGINRRINCENANIDKVAKAYVKHMLAIEKINKTIGFDNLPESLAEIAKIRMEYPDESLKELGERLTPPIGKSGVNHRLNRILEISKKLDDK